MAEFSLDIDGIKDEVEKTFREEENRLKNSPIKTQAKNNADAIFESDLNNPAERERIMKPLEDFGLVDMAKSAQRNELLSTRFANFSKGGEDASNIGEQLSQLNIQLKDLDPAQVSFTKRGIFGKIQNPVKKYFNKYQKAEDAIDEIMKSLDKSSKVLQNDNVTLLQEENTLRESTNKLLADIEMGKMMDESIEAQIEKARIKGISTDKIDIVKEEILFPLRQRVMDLQQMIVINQQAIISLNVIRKNNKELIRGVNRAKNVTITALRTGVMVASALYDQKVVIDKINMLNDTTGNIIESTSRILREQGNEIQKTSVETMISPEILQKSFNEAMAAVEDVSTYKQNALPKMKETIKLFSDMAIDGQRVVDKIESAENIGEISENNRYLE